MEQFQLILVSGDFPDLMFFNWGTHFPGGPSAAIADGVVIRHNELIDTYAHNFRQILADHPYVRNDAITDEGDFYMMPFLRLNPADRTSGAFFIRQDWLDNLGLDRPTNINEWEYVLTAFRDRDPNGDGQSVIPFISTPIVEIHGVQQWMSAWGLSAWNNGFMNVDGAVQFGPAMDEYREFLTTMARWYREGLIDPDFLTTDRARHSQLVTTDQAGAFYGLINSFMGAYTGIMNDINPDFDLRAAHFPQAPDGGRYIFQVDAARAVAPAGFAITTANRHPRESMLWMDYFYYEDGRILMNLGIENESFIVNPDGSFAFTELVTDSGLPLDQSIARLAPAGTSARLFQDPRYWILMMAHENQVEAMPILGAGDPSRILPPITMTPEDSQRFATVFSQIQTFVGESFARFVLGTDDIDAGWDSYINTLHQLGIEEAIELQQRALEAYFRR